MIDYSSICKYFDEVCMKKILAFGDSNTWGFIPGEFNFETNRAKRYPKHQRWGGVLSGLLGSDYEVIEEGLSSRTAVLDDPYSPVMTNGKSYLLPCLLSHHPLDMVVIMLGTNELKTRFNLNSFDVSKGIRQLIWLIRSLAVGVVSTHPEILIICPPVVIEGVGIFKDQFVGAADKSKEMAEHYKYICQIEQCHFLNAGEFAQSSVIDGIHLDSENQQALGQAVYRKVLEIFNY